MKLDFTMQDTRFGALIAFAAVSEAKSFTRAAQKLGISRRTLHRKINELNAGKPGARENAESLSLRADVSDSRSAP